MDRADEVIGWNAQRGWSIGAGPGRINQITPDLSRLRPVPADVFDAKR